MGLFDELDLAGVRWQTKALGKRYRILKPGDEVRVEALAASDAEYAVADSYEYLNLPDTYTIEIHCTARALVSGGKLVRLLQDDDDEPAVASFDYYGRSVDQQYAELFPDYDNPAPGLEKRPIPRPPRRPRRPRRDQIKITPGEPVTPDQMAKIMDEIRTGLVSSGFHSTDDDEAAISRIITGETCFDQEREQMLAELTASRGGPPEPGEPLNDNILGLTDPAELHIAERRLVSCRLAELYLKPLNTEDGIGRRLAALADLIRMTRGKGNGVVPPEDPQQP